MGLLSALGLPQPKFMPMTARPTAKVAPGAKPKAAANGKPVGPVVDDSNLVSPFAGPIVDETNIAVPQRTKTIAKIEPESEATTEAAAPSQGAPVPSAAPPVSLEVTKGKDSVTWEKTADGESVVVKHEWTKPVFKKTFMVGPVPCWTKGDVMLSVEGEISRKGNVAGLKVQVTAAGALSIGSGIAEGPLTVGPGGTAKLSSSQGVAVTCSEAHGVAADAFVCEVTGTGSVGIEATIDNGPSIKTEAKLVEWKLLIVHVGGIANGKLMGMRVEPGPDLLRLCASLENAGKRITQAVDDAGDALERGARAVIDPGGETGREVTERNKKATEESNASSGSYIEAMQPLETTLREFNTQAERKVVEDAHQADNDRAARGEARTEEWRGKCAGLIGIAIHRRTQAQMAEIAKREKARVQADEDLKRRVRESEARVVTAWKAMENLGNPLNQRMLATGDNKLADCWRAGMKFRDPGSLKMKQLKSFDGDTRIAKADEVVGLFEKARVEFQRGSLIP